MSISLTQAAANHIEHFLKKRGKGLGVRLSVKTTGCSGLSYVIEYADALSEGDQTFKNHGVTIVVDAKSLIYLDGTELDFVKEGLNEGFQFTNPNEKSRCGCGESFSI